jgi:threonine/homoserine/homoserine lactone efflux protein
MEHWFSMILFAVSTAVTPGPNTLLAMLSGLNFGIAKSLPLLFGISIGFSLMLFLVGIGLGQILTLYPTLSLIVNIAGLTYLLYLAWKIATSSVDNQQRKQTKPLNFFKGVLFQWVNPKAWVVCISAVSVYTTSGDLYFMQTTVLASIFLLIGLPCVGCWVMFGALLRQQLKHTRFIRGLNVAMALLLLTSIAPMLIDIQHIEL